MNDMKFLCTKVKENWLTSPQNREKVTAQGLSIKEPFIGMEINNNEPSEEEKNKVDKAVNNLFGNHIKAFPIRLIEL
ncbi:MAG: hypothetical protein A3B68_08520 [Candidatus Melainabacteria bacterium RIFCSPHIGHO2_02_FULL_34_12]|nr:MAG: hypothetical protein A3B68_08520 [Candidatus Melainabacteria bacterium RIFCSPHIGHO2_02_FULL_34_12]